MRSRLDESRRTSSRALAVAIVLLACASVALVASRPDTAEARVRRPITLRIEGFFDPAPDGVRPIDTIEVRIGKEQTRSLAVTKIINQGEGPLGASILDEAARYKPAFRLLGSTTLVAKLAAASPRARVTLTGHLTSGRNVLLSLVDIAPAAAPSPVAAPTGGG